MFFKHSEKLLNILAAVIIACYSVCVILYTFCFVPFKAVQQMLRAAAFCKKGKGFGFQLVHDPFLAACRFAAFIAVGETFLGAAFPCFTPFPARTVLRKAALTMLVFGAKAAGETAAGYAKFFFHLCILLFVYFFQLFQLSDAVLVPLCDLAFQPPAGEFLA